MLARVKVAKLAGVELLEACARCGSVWGDESGVSCFFCVWFNVCFFFHISGLCHFLGLCLLGVNQNSLGMSWAGLKQKKWLLPHNFQCFCFLVWPAQILSNPRCSAIFSSAFGCFWGFDLPPTDRWKDPVAAHRSVGSWPCPSKCWRPWRRHQRCLWCFGLQNGPTKQNRLNR